MPKTGSFSYCRYPITLCVLHLGLDVEMELAFVTFSFWIANRLFGY